MPTPKPTITWRISNIERETVDGFVFSARYEVVATQGEHSAGVTGIATFERHDGTLEPYENLKEDAVIQWCKDHVDAAAVEAEALERLAEVSAPKTAAGIPWWTYTPTANEDSDA